MASARSRRAADVEIIRVKGEKSPTEKDERRRDVSSGAQSKYLEKKNDKAKRSGSHRVTRGHQGQPTGERRGGSVRCCVASQEMSWPVTLSHEGVNMWIKQAAGSPATTTTTQQRAKPGGGEGGGGGAGMT